MNAAWASGFHHVPYVARKPRHESQGCHHGKGGNRAPGKPPWQCNCDKLQHGTAPDTQQTGKAASRVRFRQLFIKDINHLAAEVAAHIPGIENKKSLVTFVTHVEDGGLGFSVPHGEPTFCVERSVPATPYDPTPLRMPCGPYGTADNSGVGVRSRMRSKFLQ